MEEQVAVIYTGTKGYLDDLETKEVGPFIEALRQYLKSSKPEFISGIQSGKTLSPELEAILKTAIGEAKQNFKA